MSAIVLIIFTSNGNTISEQTISQADYNNALKHSEDVFTISNPDVLKHYVQVQNLSGEIYNSVLGTLDTLSNLKMWSGSENGFAFFGQDVLMQWYIAPANMTIKAVGYKTINAAPDGSTIGVRIFKLNPWWNFQQLSDANTTNWGYYPASGDGFNEVTPFPFEATGLFEDLTGLGCTGILDSCLWSGEDSTGYITTPITGQYTWVEMSVMGYEPSVYQGDIIAIVLQNNSTVMSHQVNSENSRIQISFNYSPPVIGYNAFKFYESGRSGLNNGTGWWSRELDLNIVLVSDLTGDRAPEIESLTDIPDTIWNAAIDVEAVVTDDNPADGSSGVSSVKLYFETSSAPLDSILMTNSGGNTYVAQIPGQVGGTGVVYYVKATDVEGNVSLPFGYSCYIRNFNDFYSYIERNRIKMWLSNNGDGSYDPTTTQAGFYWPIDITDSTQAIFEDGLVWGGYQDGNLKAGGSTYRHGLAAGKIISPGVPADPNSSQYRVYRIRKGWENLPPGALRDSFETDYNE
jgi:hypothetical protein